MTNKNEVLTLGARLVVPLGNTPEELAQDELIPMLTWADWELLQELHKARAGSTPPITINYTMPSELGGTAKGHSSSMGSSLNYKAISADLQDQIKDWETKCGHLETSLESTAKSLQTALEIKGNYLKERDDLLKERDDLLEHLASAKDRNVQLFDKLKHKETQIAELSKSLQHYRNAYFADQGDDNEKS